VPGRSLIHGRRSFTSACCIMSTTTIRKWLGETPRAGCNCPHRYGHDLNRLKPIFKHAFESFEDVIRLNPQSSKLLQTARNALAAALPELQHAYVGVHVRRGDRSIKSYRLDFSEADTAPLTHDTLDTMTSTCRWMPTRRTLAPHGNAFVGSTPIHLFSSLRILLTHWMNTLTRRSPRSPSRCLAAACPSLRKSRARRHMSRQSSTRCARKTVSGGREV
jgi:hypothetical protein